MRELVEPVDFEKKMDEWVERAVELGLHRGKLCKWQIPSACGRGRFASEHWPLSHPSVSCTCYYVQTVVSATLFFFKLRMCIARGGGRKNFPVTIMPKPSQVQMIGSMVHLTMFLIFFNLTMFLIFFLSTFHVSLQRELI